MSGIGYDKSGGINVYGAKTFYDVVTFNSSSVFNTAITYTTSSTFNSSATFNGTSSFAGPTTFSSTIALNGASTFAGASTFNGTTTLNGTSSLTGPTTFSKTVVLTPVTLTSAASVTIDASLGNIFYLPLSVAGATTFNAPTNPTNGQQLSLIIRHTTGSNTATWNSAWYFPGGVDAILSTTSGSTDMISAVYTSNIGSGVWLTTFAKGFA